jgi:predicted dehydrogenase
MEVYGQTGYVITVKRDDIRVRRAGNDSHEEQATAKPIPPPYDTELAYFRAVILEGAREDALSSLDTNVTVTEILDAARRSAKEGRTIQLPKSR